MIRVVVADDQELVRAGIASIVTAQPDLEVVGEAGDGAEAAAAAREGRADVVLMDVQMPRHDGLAGLRLAARSRPEARVLMLTMFDLDEHVYGALRAGASGFLLKSTPPTELVRAIRGVHAGDLLFAPEVTTRLVEAFVRRPPSGEAVPQELARLSQRELEVFALVARGLSNAEIATHLHLGEPTVKTHLGQVKTKLGLRDRVQAVVLAYETGFIGPSR